MSTTLSLQSSINFAQAYLGYKQLNIGASNEPSATAANMILQTIISPPFCWNWNRASTSFVTSVGVQDYAQTVQNFGFIEKASYVPAGKITSTALTSNVATYMAANSFSAGDMVIVTGTSNGGGIFNVSGAVLISATPTQFTVGITNADVLVSSDSGTATSGKVAEITNVDSVLGSGNESGAPAFIAPQIDDNLSTITFRLLAIPDQVYQINVIYQKKNTGLIASLTDTWRPIPDHYSFVYQWGFLTMMLAYQNDARWTSTSQKFVSALLGVAEGLREEERNIFQAAWLSMVSEQQARGLQTTQGTQSRGI